MTIEQTPSSPGRSPEAKVPAETEGVAARLKIIAGLMALATGVGALVVIVALSLWLEPSPAVSQIVSGAVSAIASIVAAYFGIKLGNDNAAAQQGQTQQAVDAQREEANKAQVFAGLLDPAEARRALMELGLTEPESDQPPSGGGAGRPSSPA